MGPLKRSLSYKKELLRRYIEEKGLKITIQRDLITDTFLKSQTHVSLEELLHQVRKKNPRIGYATVYRTMKLLTECGIAVERHFGDGQTRYEPLPDSHHDHLICTRCGKILEFEDERIERLQHEVARERNFEVISHKLELYGLCLDCQKKGKKT